MRLCVFAVSIVLLAAPWMRGWSNGETISIYHDLRSGMIFPMQKTPIEVRHQRLTFQLDPPYATIETTYTLYNPTKQSLTVHIAFAIPGDVTLQSQPVWFDGKPIRWRYQLSDEVLREVAPVLRQSVEQGLQRRPHLQRALQEAIRQTPTGVPISSDRFYEILRRYAPDIDNAPIEAAYSYYLLKVGSRPRRDLHVFSTEFDDPEPRAWARIATALGSPQSLPHVRWNAVPRYLNIRTGALLTSREVHGDYSNDSVDDLYPLSLLRFNITLQPRQQHTLRVRYGQAMGHYELRGVGDGPSTIDGGYHLMYLLRTQSWAKYGAIDVEISIPAAMRLRTHPVARFAEQRNGKRIYRARLYQPKGNFHIVVAEQEEVHNHPVLVRMQDNPYGMKFSSTFLAARLINGEPYVRFSDVAPPDHRPTVQAKETTLHLGERTYKLRYPVRTIDGALYLHLRDALTHDFAYYLPNREHRSDDPLRRLREDFGIRADARICYDARRGAVILEQSRAFAGGTR